MIDNPDYRKIIGEENISAGAKGEPIISDAGFERLIDAIENGTLKVPEAVRKSAIAMRSGVQEIRKTMQDGAN